MNFFKHFLASVLGTVVAFIIIGVLLFVGIASMATLITAEEMQVAEIKSESILRLDLDQPIYDNIPAAQELEVALGLNEETYKFYDLVQAIRKASQEEKIKAIDLVAQYPQLGWSQAQTLRKALEEFRASGKLVYAHGDYFSQKGYYIASVSDSIFLHPMGGMEFKGLAAEVLYYKDFQEKYGLKMEVIRHGKYKSAVEPYLENEMSESNRMQIDEMLQSVWTTVQEAVGASRQMNREQLDAIANSLSASLPEDARANGLIDGLLYEDDYTQKLKDIINSEEKLRVVEVQQLIGNNGLYTKGVRDRIAVIYAQGPVLYGEGSEFVIGQEVFLDAIEEATNNRRVKAIVLRIDSPGGSALTSDILWKALMEAKKKKPLVVSMGNVAASGGYYLAAAGDEIYANDLTITGSIGVFATVPNAKSFAESYGINAQHVQTHDNALGISLFKAPEGGARASIKKGITHVYDTFKQRVAEGRGLSLDEVEQIAQGRVWMGPAALDNGLIDGLGGMDEALAAAARLAEIEEYNLISYPKIEPEFDDIIGVMGPLGKAMVPLQGILPKEVEVFLSRLNNHPPQVQYQAQLPFAVEIE